MDVIIGLGIGLCVSVLIGTSLFADKVAMLDIKSVQNVINKCPTKMYSNIILVGKANGEHRSTTIHCGDGSVVTMDNSKEGE